MVLVVLPTKFHFVVLSKSVKHILVSRSSLSNHTISLPTLLQSDDGIREDLPFIGDWRSHTSDVCSVVREMIGIDAYAVNVLWHRPFRAGDFDVPGHVMLQLDLFSDDFTLPAGLDWVDCDSALPWALFYKEIDISAILSTLLTRIKGHGSQSSSPWRSIGWFTDVESWAISVINRHGMHVVDRLEQITNMSQSTVLSCKVDQVRVNGAPLKNWHTDGFVYVKVTHRTIPEPKITQSVSTAMSACVPPLLAVDEERNAFIQIGVDEMDECAPEDVLKELASFHMSSIEKIEQLRADGIPYRGLPWIRSNVHDILHHPALDLCNNREILRGLRGRIDEVQHVCNRLIAYDIPDTLVHGDCDESNIRSVSDCNQDLIFIDWATCCVGCPLFDLFRITVGDGWEESLFESKIDSYFTVWSGFECQKKMPEAFRLVKPLFFYFNLSVLLNFYAITEAIEQPMLLEVFDNGLESINKALDEIHDYDSAS